MGLTSSSSRWPGCARGVSVRCRSGGLLEPAGIPLCEQAALCCACLPEVSWVTIRERGPIARSHRSCNIVAEVSATAMATAQLHAISIYVYCIQSSLDCWPVLANNMSMVKRGRELGHAAFVQRLLLDLT